MNTAVHDDPQVLIFLLGAAQFGIDILRIQEIRGSDRPAPIPATPDFVKGVTNLRGQFVPVIDLRVRLGIGDASREGVTIILRAGEDRVGIVVDAVSEVMPMAREEVKPPPRAEFAPSAACLLGLVRHGEDTVILLDIDRLLASSDDVIRDVVAGAQAACAIAA